MIESDVDAGYGKRRNALSSITKIPSVLHNYGQTQKRSSIVFVVIITAVISVLVISSNQDALSIAPIANSILINEVELNPSGGGQGGDNNSTDGVMEQIELYNPTSVPIDVSGWTVQTLHGIQETITINSSTIIPSGGYLLVGQDPQWLDNVNETVALRNGTGVLVDSVGPLLNSVNPLSDEFNDARSWQRVPNGSDTWVFRQNTLGGSNDVLVNNPPVVDAGANQTVDEGDGVTLNGTLSSDSDGTIASYAWNQTAGPSVTLSDNTTALPTFTAPSVDEDTTLTFSLVVTDNDNASSAADTVDVLVHKVPPQNHPAAAIQDLIALKEGMHLHKGTTTSLDAKLNAALKSVNSEHNNTAANQLEAFIHQVNALAGKKLTQTQADQLVTGATDIINMLS